MVNHIFCIVKNINKFNWFQYFSSDSDIIIGAFDDNLLMSEYFVASFPYYHDELTWCVQKSGPIPLWRNVFKLCEDLVVLSVFALMCIVYVATMFVMQQYEDTHPKWDWTRTSFSIIRLLSGLVMDYSPKLHSARLFFTSCLFGCMIFDTVFIALWTKCMTTPFFEHQVKSRQEIIDNRFGMAGDYFAF